MYLRENPDTYITKKYVYQSSPTIYIVIICVLWGNPAARIATTCAL